MKWVAGRDIFIILKSIKGKKVILFGSGKLAGNILNKLACLDISVAYCVDYEFKDISVNHQVNSYFDLLLEEDFFVIIANENVEKCAECLTSIGLSFPDDFNSFFGAADFVRNDMVFALDPMLGYSMPYKETKGTGIKIFGESNTFDYRIAILGGSTSDPCCYNWKSWGELLYEKMLSEGWKITVIVGAVAGYSSSEELLKLIRDILPLNPDLIISYSGVNDKMDRKFPYLNSYQRQIFGRLCHNQKGIYNQRIVNNYNVGTQNENSAAAIWLQNQELMHAVSETLSIQFHAFLQPNLVTKNKGTCDKEVYEYINNKIISAIKMFEGEVKEILEKVKNSYIEDATRWLDNIDGIFYDYCHVTEEGNKIIADKMFEYIKENYERK